MAVESVESLIRRHAREVEGLKDAQATAFAKALEEARQTIEGRLAAAGSSPLSAFQLRSQLHEIEGAILALKQRGRSILSSAESDASAISVAQLNSELRLMGQQFGDPVRVTLGVARELADDVRGLLANQFESSVERYGLDLLSKVRGRLIAGLLTGDSPAAMAKEITGRAGALGVVSRNEADRLVRTEISHAYGLAAQTATKQAKKQIPDLRKTWIHVGSYPCPICDKLNGTTRETDGTWTFKSGKRTYTVAGPPAHPHCVCRTVAMRASWKKALDKLGYGRIDLAA